MATAVSTLTASSFDEELNFLLQLESLKTKAMHYSHIDPAKIFIFN